MNNFDLSNQNDDHINDLPSFNNVANSMVLLGSINTMNINHSMTLICNPQNQQNQEQDSLGLRLKSEYNKKKINQEVLENNGVRRKKKLGCTCTRTGCLKMYCQCFSIGKYCQEGCNCQSCINQIQFKQEIQVARQKAKLKNRRKKCNCKKTHCNKKYCQCFNLGFKCTPQCNCTDCHNHQFQSKQISQYQHFNTDLLL